MKVFYESYVSAQAITNAVKLIIVIHKNEIQIPLAA